MLGGSGLMSQNIWGAQSLPGSVATERGEVVGGGVGRELFHFRLENVQSGAYLRRKFRLDDMYIIIITCMELEISHGLILFGGQAPPPPSTSTPVLGGGGHSAHILVGMCHGKVKNAGLWSESSSVKMRVSARAGSSVSGADLYPGTRSSCILAGCNSEVLAKRFAFGLAAVNRTWAATERLEGK